MTKKYRIEYDMMDLADVEIADTSSELVREMVEFWGNAEERLDEAGGDYNKALLGYLADFLLENRRIPGEREDDEGWYKLDGTFGITVSDFFPHEFNRDSIEITDLPSS